MQDPKKMKVVFMGTSSFAAKILSAILEEKYNVAGVYTQPGKKVGRDQEISPTPVKILAENNKLAIFEPEKFDEVAISKLKGIDPKLIIVAAYGKILPRTVLEIPSFGCLNIHASLLPKFRGPSPIQNALLRGEIETGITIMLMNEGIDTGDILSQEKIAIDQNETFPELSEKLSKISAELILKTIPLWISKKITPVPQDNSKAVLCQLIEREDGKIFWTDEAKDIYNRYRAFFSWPGIYAFWERNGKIIRIKLNKIGLMEIGREIPRRLGEVFQIGEKIGVMASGGGIILLEEVQLEGKDSVFIKEFINGYPDLIGTILK